MEYKLSINGLYNYDKTIFDNFHIPEVWSYSRLGIPADQYVDPETVQALTIDKNVLFSRICLDTLPFSCIYASAPVLRAAIDIWSASELPRWQALYNTLFYKFNPMWNKDANYTESHNTDTDTNINRTSSAIDRTTYTSAAKDRNTDLVRSYEDGDTAIRFERNIPYTMTVPYQTRKMVAEHSTKEDGENNEARGISDNIQNYPQHTEDVPEYLITNVNPPPTEPPEQVHNFTPSGAQDLSHQLQSINNFDHAFTDAQANDEHSNETITRREYGNIGVTSTQELIERSRKLALMNIYDIIISDFIKYFCVTVY